MTSASGLIVAQGWNGGGQLGIVFVDENARDVPSPGIIEGLDLKLVASFVWKGNINRVNNRHGDWTPF